MKSDELIEKLGLKPHPVEGGYFLETYRSEELVPIKALSDKYEGNRHFSTAIYYLLTPDTFSEIHRLPSDEVFHFYSGDPVEMIHLYDDGSSQKFIMGSDILSGHEVQLVVPGMVWQGCRLVTGGQYALLGCTVAPGFDFKDYQAGTYEELKKQYPQESEMIKALTKESDKNDKNNNI